MLGTRGGGERPLLRRLRTPTPRADRRPPALPPASPADEITASRHDDAAHHPRGRVHRGPPRRRALKFSRPRPVRSALPSRHAPHAVATRAARAVAKASASQAVATRAASRIGRAQPRRTPRCRAGDSRRSSGDRNAPTRRTRRRARCSVGERGGGCTRCAQGPRASRRWRWASAGADVELRRGPSPGTPVVMHPGDAVRDGVSVRDDAAAR